MSKETAVFLLSSQFAAPPPAPENPPEAPSKKISQTSIKSFSQKYLSKKHPHHLQETPPLSGSTTTCRRRSPITETYLFCSSPLGVNLWLVHQFHYFDPILTNPGVTRGHARWWHLSSISCKNDSQNGGLQFSKFYQMSDIFLIQYKRLFNSYKRNIL